MFDTPLMRRLVAPLRRGRRFWVTFGLWWLGITTSLVSGWILLNFGPLELSQFIYHVVNMVEVAKPMGAWFIVFSALGLVVGPIAASFGLAVLSERYRLARTEADVTKVRPGWSTVPQVVLSSALIPAILAGVGSPVFASTVGVFSFIGNAKSSPLLERYYDFPDTVYQPEKPTNLVMIYVESLENTYRDESLWGTNLLGSLDQATAGWMEFPEFREVRGTGWTIAGIVASQCGVLLKDENPLDIRQLFGKNSINRIGERADEFMPGITCMGDILDEAGYRNHFLGGADPEFAGKGKFLADHGFDVVKGLPTWEAMGETNFSKWGLYDDRLLDYARAELDYLHAQGEPFNLTVLTVDTHRPEGHISPTCAKRGVEDLPGIIECTSDMLADFVGYMRAKGYLEDTAVVITGDHLTMPNSVQDDIDQAPSRTIYNRFWSPEPVAPNRDEFLHFSMMPTVLDILGFDYPGNEMALGVSGVGVLEPGDLDFYHLPDLDDQLRRPSPLYEEFWGSSQGPS